MKVAGVTGLEGWSPSAAYRALLRAALLEPIIFESRRGPSSPKRSGGSDETRTRNAPRWPMSSACPGGLHQRRANAVTCNGVQMDAMGEKDTDTGTRTPRRSSGTRHWRRVPSRAITAWSRTSGSTATRGSRNTTSRMRTSSTPPASNFGTRWLDDGDLRVPRPVKPGPRRCVRHRAPHGTGQGRARTVAACRERGRLIGGLARLGCYSPIAERLIAYESPVRCQRVKALKERRRRRWSARPPCGGPDCRWAG